MEIAASSLYPIKQYPIHYEGIKGSFPDIDIQKLATRIHNVHASDKSYEPFQLKRMNMGRVIYYNPSEETLIVPLKTDEINRDDELAKKVIKTDSLKHSLAVYWNFRGEPDEKLVSKKTVELRKGTKDIYSEIQQLENVKDVPSFAQLLGYTDYTNKNGVDKFIYLEELKDSDLLEFINALDNGVIDITFRDRAFLAYQVLKILDYLHVNSRLAYFDMKLENLLIDLKNLEITLTDLESCKRCDYHETNERLGTFRYWPPEKIKHHNHSSIELHPIGQDLWAAGCVLHALFGLDIPKWMIQVDKIQDLLEKGSAPGERIRPLLKKYHKEIKDFFSSTDKFKKPNLEKLEEVSAYIVCRLWMEDPHERMQAREAMQLLAPFIEDKIVDFSLPLPSGLDYLDWATQDLFESYAERMETEASTSAEVVRESYLSTDGRTHHLFNSIEHKRLYLPIRTHEMPEHLKVRVIEGGEKKFSFAWMWSIDGRIELVAKKTLNYSDRKKSADNEIVYLNKYNGYPHIISLYDYCIYTNEKGTKKAVFFEPLYQGDFYHLINERHPKKELSLYEKMQIVYKVLDGAQTFHSNGDVHRDLKTENILFKEEEVCITDLATCRPVDDKKFDAGPLGTLVMWSPEKVAFTFDKGETPKGIPQDLWAMGNVIQELFRFPTPSWKEELSKISQLLNPDYPHKFSIKNSIPHHHKKYKKELERFYSNSRLFKKPRKLTEKNVMKYILHQFWMQDPEKRISFEEAKNLISPFIS